MKGLTRKYKNESVRKWLKITLLILFRIRELRYGLTYKRKFWNTCGFCQTSFGYREINYLSTHGNNLCKACDLFNIHINKRRICIKSFKHKKRPIGYKALMNADIQEWKLALKYSFIVLINILKAKVESK